MIYQPWRFNIRRDQPITVILKCSQNLYKASKHLKEFLLTETIAENLFTFIAAFIHLCKFQITSNFIMQHRTWS